MNDSISQQNKKKWVYFDQPKALQSFDYSTKLEVLIPFHSALPKEINATKAKLILFLRTGNQERVTFWTKIHVIDQSDELVHWTYGHRYPQSAISYNSQTIEIPCQKTRQFRVKSNHIQPSNCHLMQFFISGYIS